MVGKWQRDQTTSGDIALHAADDKPVLQLLGWRRSREYHWLIPVGDLQCPKPSYRMEDGRLGVMCHEFRPPGVFCRIKPINHESTRLENTLGGERSRSFPLVLPAK